MRLTRPKVARSDVGASRADPLPSRRAGRRSPTSPCRPAETSSWALLLRSGLRFSQEPPPSFFSQQVERLCNGPPRLQDADGQRSHLFP